MTIHDLKCWPEFFQAVVRGDKPFEVRREGDRVFQVGDALRLREYRPCDSEPSTDDFTGYTGNVAVVQITYILRGAKDSPTGLPPGVCVMALRAYGRAVAYADPENFALIRAASEAVIMKYDLCRYASVVGTVVTCQGKAE